MGAASLVGAPVRVARGRISGKVSKVRQERAVVY